MAGREQREAHEAEVRRRWDRSRLLASGDSLGAAMVAVIDRIGTLDLDTGRRLDQAYWVAGQEAEAVGRRKDWEKAFLFSAPYPDYPGSLFAIDPESRSAFSYAGLMARERAFGWGADVGLVPVERAAMGVVLSLSAQRAAKAGRFHPVDQALADLLARPWRRVVGDPADGALSQPA